MSSTLYFPNTNPVRLAITSWKNRNSDDVAFQRFRDFSQPYGKDLYFQPWQKDDVLRFQFDSSFDVNLAQLKDYDTDAVVLGELLDLPVQWSDGTVASWSGGSAMKWPGTASNLTTLYEEGGVKKIAGLFLLDTVQEGKYYLEISGSHTDGETYVATSEPLEIKTTQERTAKLTWWNNSLFAGVDWREGGTFEMRVKGWFNNTQPVHTFSIARNALQKLLPMATTKANYRELKIWDRVPLWVVQKINEIGQHQNVLINGVEVGFSEQMPGEVINDRFLWVKGPSVSVEVESESYQNKLESLTRVSA